jgi:hypothetical protein
MSFQCPNCKTNLEVVQAGRGAGATTQRASTNNIGAMLDHIKEQVMMGAQLSDWEDGFLNEEGKGMFDRFAQYGSGIRVSPKQLEALQKIHAKIGVD